MRTGPPELPGTHTTDSPLDRALALMLADEREAALRWSAAVVDHDASVPSALILTCRLLADAGRTEAAIEGLEVGVKRAIEWYKANGITQTFTHLKAGTTAEGK